MSRSASSVMNLVSTAEFEVIAHDVRPDMTWFFCQLPLLRPLSPGADHGFVSFRIKFSTAMSRIDLLQDHQPCYSSDPSLQGALTWLHSPFINLQRLYMDTSQTESTWQFIIGLIDHSMTVKLLVTYYDTTIGLAEAHTRAEDARTHVCIHHVHICLSQYSGPGGLLSLLVHVSQGLLCMEVRVWAKVRLMMVSIDWLLETIASHNVIRPSFMGFPADQRCAARGKLLFRGSMFKHILSALATDCNQHMRSSLTHQRHVNATVNGYAFNILAGLRRVVQYLHFTEPALGPCQGM
ncbi:conserved hypothetical protein [Coccidioides posadasii str. Silveira]|uniref:Uncharacterized protein n=1 Tax=Coccidioides posadasii (strain RMSCC 757 / Silveira) TaxID=443226 RepID=E9D5K4_COCPS|nr:conserved hypothetical protein [Coccidioides posadasii str. Silveira]